MYAENKQFELAIMDLDKAVELEPENQNYYLARAYLHKEQGNKRKALADFEAAIKNGVPRASLEEELKSLK
jgi:Tfp pilus assembly protein PilF